jgi:DNA primase
VENNDSVAINIKDYLINVRGISLATIAEMEIRYNKQRNLIIFPLTDIRGNIQVLRARVCDINTKVMFTISPKQFGDRYALPTIRDSGACFGLNKITVDKPAIIVESETDCLLLKTYGFNNVIATTSASFSKTQIYSIPSPNLWVGFDNDDAGRRATKKLIDISNGKLVHVINWENAGGKDPGDAENRLDIVRAINKKVLVDKKARHRKYF